MNLLKGSFWLKMSALVMAILSYGLIRSEIARREAKEQAGDPSYKLIKLTAKTLPVNVRIESAPPAGYAIDENAMQVTPSTIVAIGPEALLDSASSAQTAIIDISESTKTVTRKIPIENIAGNHITGSPYAVEVTVPIRKIAPDPAAAPTVQAQDFVKTDDVPAV